MADAKWVMAAAALGALVSSGVTLAVTQEVTYTDSTASATKSAVVPEPAPSDLRPLVAPTSPASGAGLVEDSNLRQAQQAQAEAERARDQAEREREEVEEAADELRRQACQRANEMTFQIIDLERNIRELKAASLEARRASDQPLAGIALERQTRDLTFQVMDLRSTQMQLRVNC
jgi:type IV secretory pathway VirB10-like protein